MHDAIETSAVEAGYAHVQDFVVDVMERAREAGLFSSSTPGQSRLPLSA